MSVDFVVFDADAAPRSGKAFRAWYDKQVDWDMDSPFPAPAILSPSLQLWYASMITRFPDMHRSQSNGDTAIDYCFSEHFMYCSMSPSRSNDAWKLAQELASTNGLGTYDPMSDDELSNRCIVFPEGPLPDEPSWISRIFGKSKG